MTRTFDAVVVGGGMVGAACGLALSRAGMQVALVESGEPGGGATKAAMGHVVVLDDSPAQLALSRYSQQLWQQMASALPAEAEYTRRGTLWLAADDEEMLEVRRKHGVYCAQGIPCEVLDGLSVADAEPALRRPLAGGLLVNEDVVVAPQIAARSLMQDSFTLVCGRAATMGAGRVVLDTGEPLVAPILINAAGEWASALTPRIPVQLRKGHLAITLPYPGLLRHQVVELGYLKSVLVTATESVAFNAQPRANGQILVGSSRQYGEMGRAVEPAIMERMFARATEFLPVLPTLAMERTWTGFRSATPDKLPLIGPWTGDATVYLATGHEGLGITTSLGTAQLLADFLTGRIPAIPIEPYLPSRSFPR